MSYGSSSGGAKIQLSKEEFQQRKRYMIQKEWNISPEYDTTVRKAKVYVFKRPIQSSVQVNIQAAWHWALVLEFEDGSYRTAEGIGDDYGMIIPIYDKIRPAGNGKYIEVGEVYISPSQFRNYVLNNDYNGKSYGIIAANCQHWVVSLSENFGDDVLKNVSCQKRSTDIALGVMQGVVAVTLVNPLAGLVAATVGLSILGSNSERG